ncbi:YicC/YloC family endoribonuclease [uncultured Cytophaga sp.]|uniref:YicC/YloC family endoribonuclease n=1 Tax=uncultured Cytophaga sp. TaxID=160238 RepID=UPI002616BF9A|nr:YicC/YloC family endoribonuclease [uncultured Cytophaga sp.]
MIKSMTGYGSHTAENDKISVSVEIKSLNSKFLDLNLRLSKEYSDRELEVRNILNNTIERGKVGLNIDVQSKGGVKAKVFINRELVALYYKDLKETADAIGASDSDLFKLALQMPKAMESEAETEDSSEDWALIQKVLVEAIAKCNEFRKDEGKTLSLKFQEYIKNIGDALTKVEAFDPQRIEAIRTRIRQHFDDYSKSEQLDNSRFEQELIFYIEKLDISEEKVRLRSHLSYFLEAMEGAEANGKKLGFIAQEIGREINTIGSKANDANIQRSVVQMKEELEKIKEQSLNIL